MILFTSTHLPFYRLHWVKSWGSTNGWVYTCTVLSLLFSFFLLLNVSHTHSLSLSPYFVSLCLPYYFLLLSLPKLPPSPLCSFPPFPLLLFSTSLFLAISSPLFLSLSLLICSYTHPVLPQLLPLSSILYVAIIIYASKPLLQLLYFLLLATLAAYTSTRDRGPRDRRRDRRDKE